MDIITCNSISKNKLKKTGFYSHVVCDYLVSCVTINCHHCTSLRTLVYELKIYNLLSCKFHQPLGCAVSGLIADSRTMVDKARVEGQVS